MDNSSTEKKNAALMRAIKLVHGAMHEKTDLEKDRQSRETLGSILGKMKDIAYEETLLDDMTAEWVRPERPHGSRYALLYCHGGGYITGSEKFARILTAKLALSAMIDTFCFDYRLAPEFPYPAALTDALRAWDYLMLLGYGADEVFVAGDSAGGNLALSLTLKLRALGRKLPKGLLLFSPWTDLTCSGASYEALQEVDPILDHAYIQNAVQAFTNGADPSDPLISPLFADFTGFPPVCLQVGANEILLDDSVRLAERLQAANVRTSFSIYEGMWHVFQMSPFKKASEALQAAAGFILDSL